MNETKKKYVKPEMTVMEVKLDPILTGSAYPTGGSRGNGGWFD